MVVAFDSLLAKEIGVKEAIVLTHIAYWVRKNTADGRNVHEGKSWTFTTQKALATYFDFLSEKQVRTIMASLKDKGYIETGNFNKLPYDRTMWYTLTSVGWKVTGSSVPNDQMVAPIPNDTTDKPTDINSSNKYTPLSISSPPSHTDFASFWEAYPKKKDKANAQKAVRKVDVPIEVLLNAIEKQKKSADWQKENGRYIPYPTTWLNGRRWEDDADPGFLHGRVNIDIRDPNTYVGEEDRSEVLNQW